MVAWLWLRKFTEIRWEKSYSEGESYVNCEMGKKRWRLNIYAGVAVLRGFSLNSCEPGFRMRFSTVIDALMICLE